MVFRLIPVALANLVGPVVSTGSNQAAAADSYLVLAMDWTADILTMKIRAAPNKNF